MNLIATMALIFHRVSVFSVSTSDPVLTCLKFHLYFKISSAVRGNWLQDTFFIYIYIYIHISHIFVDICKYISAPSNNLWELDMNKIIILLSNYTFWCLIMVELWKTSKSLCITYYNRIIIKQYNMVILSDKNPYFSL